MKNKTVKASASVAKVFILDFLESNETASVSEMLKAARSRYPDMTRSIFGGALLQLRRNGQIVSAERGVYSIFCKNADADPFVSCTISAKNHIDSALQVALKDIADCRTTIKDFGDMDAYLAKATILAETRDFLAAQLEKLNHINSKEA